MTVKRKSKNKNKHWVSLALLALITIFFKSCGIKPSSWQPPTKPKFTNKLKINKELLSSQKIDLNGWYGPEDILFDDEGNMY